MADADTSTIIGRNPVREALERADQGIEKVMLAQGASGEAIGAIRSAAKERGVPVQYVPEARLNHESQGAVHQGVVAIASPITYSSVHDLLTEVAPTWADVQDRKPLLLVIDRVTDTRNFGAILRSAVAAGVDGVIVPQSSMAPLNAAAIKASAGTATRIPIARAANLPTVLQQLKERGYWVCGAEGTSETTVWDVDFDRAMAVVLGSEGEGLASDVAAACDELASIPMRGPAESLNVSVAAGIFLLTAARPRLS
ncbi:23S rRNA (guanosine(2251)-2'-O)-methyltransferase RlmB [Longibacter salinarum]|uniref:23S rRNA (Guanosine(2251)-2'-O)-methyltransferase RlmB n=1 Tax=Longibacter salinarum TaxID=1850348 RepID=A0A2A8D2X5_9BACT|nr:23S rRNA (guanosine(2251)-2'-O)-methyltransferase RlmB [Longibacter salinarum]PEN15231.1 23S rRNA (guanosine(2251)-2'-O)-methyltransferase RlmB [Longibacter salinarum]